MSMQAMPSRARPDRAPHGRWEGRKGETMTLPPPSNRHVRMANVAEKAET